MSILDIKTTKQELKISKTIIGYMLVTLLAIAVNKIYALFGHGVSSDAMTWMFLYPLIGGVLFYLVIKLLFPHTTHFTGYRLFFNLHNSGIATLTIANMLKGILDIAGTSSPYVKLFYITGWLFIGIGLMILIRISSIKD